MISSNFTTAHLYCILAGFFAGMVFESNRKEGLKGIGLFLNAFSTGLFWPVYLLGLVFLRISNVTKGVSKNVE